MSTAKMVAEAKLATEADRRMKRVGTTAARLEADLRWIANNKAWDVKGYESFPAYFQVVHGYEPPKYLRVLLHGFLEAEGMNTRTGSSFTKHGANGHTHADLAKWCGLANRVLSASISMQREAGYADDEIVLSSRPPVTVIGPARRARGRNRDTAKSYDDRVTASVGMKKELREWYRHEADTAVTPMPYSNLMEQVLEAHRDKVEEGRKASRRTSRSKGRAA